mmetsp:Transcript_22753/g.42739  ORF Transcript_22753/g.42739 Transcript_22753/m.42739 type:complete len:229 (+) Transcript_22753:323-1009(+)
MDNRKEFTLHFVAFGQTTIEAFIRPIEVHRPGSRIETDIVAYPAGGVSAAHSCQICVSRGSVKRPPVVHHHIAWFHVPPQQLVFAFLDFVQRNLVLIRGGVVTAIIGRFAGEVRNLVHHLPFMGPFQICHHALAFHVVQCQPNRADIFSCYVPVAIVVVPWGRSNRARFLDEKVVVEDAHGIRIEYLGRDPRHRRIEKEVLALLVASPQELIVVKPSGSSSRRRMLVT